MKRRRVKITGIGFVTPAGIGRTQFWYAIQSSASYARVLKSLPEEAGVFVGMEVPNFQPEPTLTTAAIKRLPRHTQFALTAAKLALSDAKLSFSSLRNCSPLVVVGASLMDFGSINKGIDLILRKGPTSALPSTVFTASVSSIGGAIGEAIGGTTRTLTLQSACCAGSDAIGQAADMVANGEAEVALCGGTEAPLYLHPLLELRMAGLAPSNPDNPERQCRPFDLWRTTGAIGEGACMLILEPESSPRQGYAFIEGYSFSSDATEMPGSGLSQALQLALANARRKPADVDCINAWGPGHRIIDAAESLALIETFGSDLRRIPTVSIKGAIGNPLGAAGAIQVGCAALSLSKGIIPPTVNWQYPDPECPLNLSSKTRTVRHELTVVNSHGLSGTNACLVLAR
ncbi:beta-ketoacyl-[acyl-carrier-protein] synthase family protein [Horticoccus sp. 23ND18S-11]|uniref:beta-ketoacyl-[acyl-carrier-protein] synthase family protein n=1 Tax=Horticoccus sp. 23ND18S-11 TaxID=3391832 RepID=UPI0039C9223D